MMRDPPAGLPEDLHWLYRGFESAFWRDILDRLAAAHRHIDEMAEKYAAQSAALTQAAMRRATSSDV